MKIVSIDVGIRNLSFCLFELVTLDNTSNIKVISWDNIDLCEKTEVKCSDLDKKGLLCNKPAKFLKNDKAYCLKHSKKHSYLQPTPELKSSYLNKQKLQSLLEIADKYSIKYNTPIKKTDILSMIHKFIDDNCFLNVVKKEVKVDLVTIGHNIQIQFDNILADHLHNINTIIIENQIGPIANKMKTVQGMISQYFIMRNNNIDIQFISACNKLKDFASEKIKEKLSYKDRKKMGTDICNDFVNNDFRFTSWSDFFKKHKKKDDLSDCFLQGLWFINNKLD
jgi:hypothetical protein